MPDSKTASLPLGSVSVPPFLYGVETALSVVGAAIAGTLWWAHRANVELPCTSGGGCVQVSDSPWAHLSVGPLHDVPIALLGFLAYLALMTLAMAKLGTDSEASRRWLHVPFWIIAAGGAAYSWYLQYVAHFLIGAFCVWCFSSAVMMTLLLIVATWEGLRRFRRPVSTSPESRPATHV